MKRKIYLLLFILLVSFTFFYGDIGGIYSIEEIFSCGFPFPLFKIKVGIDRFEFYNNYNLILSITMNLMFLIFCLILIFRYDILKYIKNYKILYIAISINVILFNLNVVYNKLPEYIGNILTRYVFGPPFLIVLFGLFSSKNLEFYFNIASRFYFIIMTIILFFIIKLIKYLLIYFKNKLKFNK